MMILNISYVSFFTSHQNLLRKLVSVFLRVEPDQLDRPKLRAETDCRQVELVLDCLGRSRILTAL